MSHVLGYARVSTDDQDFAGQRQRLQAIGALRIFEDVVSGKTFERPGLSELLDYIRPGDTLAYGSTGSVGASASCSMSSKRSRNVASRCSPSKRRSTPRPPPANWCFHVFGAIAQFEHRLIAERTRDGMTAARAKGRKPGRPALDHDKINAALVLVKNGLTPTQAAKQTGLGRSTVYREIQGRSKA